MAGVTSYIYVCTAGGSSMSLTPGHYDNVLMTRPAVEGQRTTAA